MARCSLVVKSRIIHERRHRYGSQRGQEVRASGLFLHGDVGEILQRGVCSDGEDSGYCLQVRACWMHGFCGSNSVTSNGTSAFWVMCFSRAKALTAEGLFCC